MHSDRVVGTNGRAALEVAPEPLGFEVPLVGDEHIDPIGVVEVHGLGEDVLKLRAMGDVFVRDVMDGLGLWRDRDGRPDEVRSDDDDLSADEIDSADLHDGIVRGDARGFKVDDPEAGGLV